MPERTLTASGLNPAQKGIACTIAGGLLLTGQDAITKWLTVDYSTGEIMFWRGLFSFLPVAVLVWHAGRLRSLRPRRPLGVLLRSVLALVNSVLIIVSLRLLPLADALAIVFASPIILTALSVPLLGEPVGPRRWLAVAIGFLGVLLMVRPTGSALQLAALVPLAAAVCSALRDVVTRRLGATDRASTIFFYTLVLASGQLDSGVRVFVAIVFANGQGRQLT